MKVYFDGSCRPNPGVIETAVVVAGKTWHRADHGHGDNNDAEWLALIEAMKIARDLGLKDVVLLGDSQVVIDQAGGTARRIAPRFTAYMAEFDALKTGFDRVRARYLRRAQNLAGIAMERVHNGQ